MRIHKVTPKKETTMEAVGTQKRKYNGDCRYSVLPLPHLDPLTAQMKDPGRKPARKWKEGLLGSIEKTLFREICCEGAASTMFWGLEHFGTYSSSFRYCAACVLALGRSRLKADLEMSRGLSEFETGFGPLCVLVRTRLGPAIVWKNLLLQRISTWSL